jgi:hypothetical protein
VRLIHVSLLAAQLAATSWPAAAAEPAPDTGPASAAPAATETPVYQRALSALAGDSHSVTLRSDYYTSSKAVDDETGFFGVTAQAKVAYNLGDVFGLKFEGRAINSNLGHGNDSDTEAVLLEGYALARFNVAEIRLGTQIVPWGRADGLNPTDNLTPRDYTVLLPFEEDQRLGATALRIDGYLSDEYTLTAYTTPYFKPSAIPLPAGGAVYNETRPGHNLADSTAALRLNRSGGSLDWSVSYFHGYSLLPSVRPGGISGSVPVIDLGYDATDVLGADVARNFGRYGVRGEIAYTWTDDPHGTDPLVTNPFLYYVLGGDRTFGDNLNVNLQLVGINVHAFSDPYAIADPALRALAVQNAIIHRQQDRSTYGMTMRIADKWLHDTLEGEILLVHYFDRPNTYLRPVLTYAFTDRFKGSLGGELYRGADDTFFGWLRKNSGVFVEARYSF